MQVARAAEDAVEPPPSRSPSQSAPGADAAFLQRCVGYVFAINGGGSL